MNEALKNPFDDFGFSDENSHPSEKMVAGPLEPSGAATDLLGSDISNVGEIFAFARMLCAEARIHPGTIAPEAVEIAEEIKAYEDAYYDPPPLFLRRSA